MRDWRDGSLVDTTFFAFQAMRNVVFRPGEVARQGETFASLRENHQARDTRLVVHRDFFCGLTWLPPGDVVELLPNLTDRQRFEHLVYFFESEAMNCPGCKAFMEDPENESKKHKGAVYGGPWCTGRAVIPEMRKLLTKQRTRP